jgi:CHASE3 domain sensor protein
MNIIKYQKYISLLKIIVNKYSKLLFIILVLFVYTGLFLYAVNLSRVTKDQNQSSDQTFVIDQSLINKLQKNRNTRN